MKLKIPLMLETKNQSGEKDSLAVVLEGYLVTSPSRVSVESGSYVCNGANSSGNSPELIEYTMRVCIRESVLLAVSAKIFISIVEIKTYLLKPVRLFSRTVIRTAVTIESTKNASPYIADTIHCVFCKNVFENPPEKLTHCQLAEVINLRSVPMSAHCCVVVR